MQAFRILAAGTALSIVAFVAMAQGSISPSDTLSQPVPPNDWSLVGEVAGVLEIPDSGGAYSITLRRADPRFPGADSFLQIICDREQPITKKCSVLQVGDGVEMAGYVLSNEPATGERLSARDLWHRIPR